LKLVKVGNVALITKEISENFSQTSHQLEYLIEDSFPYDAFTFLEELEDGKIQPVLQVLLL